MSWLDGESPRPSAEFITPPDPARELSRAAKQAASWTERRNTLIREAVASGSGIREVARIVGLNHTSVLHIVSPKVRGKG